MMDPVGMVVPSLRLTVLRMVMLFMLIILITFQVSQEANFQVLDNVTHTLLKGLGPPFQVTR